MVKAFTEFLADVKFTQVSVGATTARIGVTINRKACKLNRADELFCDRRLTGTISLGRFDEDTKRQQKLIDDSDHEVNAVFDVNGFRVSADSIGLGLTFKLSEIEVGELSKLATKDGRLLISDAQEIPVEEKEKTKSPDHVPGTLKAEGPWRHTNLDLLFDPAKTIRKALAEANINTVGQLADYTATDKRLTDITGIGPGKAEEIEERMVQFFADNPDAADESK